MERFYDSAYRYMIIQMLAMVIIFAVVIGIVVFLHLHQR